MKLCLQFLILFTLVFGFKISYSEKYALLVGINKYRDLHIDHPDLVGPVNDVRSIKESLTYNDFKNENIKILTDTEATLKEFYRSFEELKQKAKDSDIIIIHFSGYEASRDTGGLLLYDKSVSESNLLALLEVFSNKSPHGDILVTLDRCFTFMKGDYSSLHFKNGNIAIFSAASPNGDAQEDRSNTKGEMMGRFSVAFYQALLTLDDTLTYNSFMQQVKKTVIIASSNKQYPFIISFIPDYRLLFRGAYTKGSPHLRIKAITGPTSLVLAAGKSSGVLEGTKITVTLAGQPNSERNVVAHGEVTSADDFISNVTLQAPLFTQSRGIRLVSTGDDSPKPDAYWGYITDRNYFNSFVHLYIKEKGIFPDREVDKALAGFKNYKLVNNSAEADLIIEKDNSSLYTDPLQTNDLTVDSAPRGRSNYSAYRFSLRDVLNNSVYRNAVSPNDLLMDVKTFWRYNFLRGLSNNNPKLDVAVETVVLRNGKPDSSAGNNVLYTGDEVGIHVTNNTENGLYINLIDISPDGNYSALLPHLERDGLNNYPLSKCFLPAYAEEYYYMKNPLVISPPYGNEILKIFVSDLEMDITSLFDVDHYVATREGVSKPLVLENMGIYSWRFKIKDKFFNDNIDDGAGMSDNNNRAVAGSSNDRAMAGGSNERKTGESNNQRSATGANNIRFEGKNGEPADDGYWHNKEPLHWHFNNPTHANVYYNLLSIDEHNNISVIYPNADHDFQSCYVPTSGEQDLIIPEAYPGMIDYYSYYSDQPFDLKTVFDKSDNKVSTFAYLLLNNKVPCSAQALVAKVNHFDIIAGADTGKGTVFRDVATPCVKLFLPTNIPCEKTRSFREKTVEEPKNTVKLQIIGEARMPDPKVKISSVNILGTDFTCDEAGVFTGELALSQENTNVEIKVNNMVAKSFPVHVPFDSIFKQTSGVNHFVGVGIDNYPIKGIPTLTNARKDVKDVAQVFEDKYGFEKKNVHLLLDTDATKSNIIKSIKKLAIQPNDNVVIYMAGHGTPDLVHPESEYYFIPADVKKVDEYPFDETSAVSGSDIAGAIKVLGAKHIILIIDACNAGALISNLVYTFQQHPPATPGASHWILTSTSSEVEASDGNGDNSPFATALLECLKSCNEPNGIELQYQIFPSVKKRMKELIGIDTKDQEPEVQQLSGFGQKDFAFHPVSGGK